MSGQLAALTSFVVGAVGILVSAVCILVSAVCNRSRCGVQHIRTRVQGSQGPASGRRPRSGSATAVAHELIKKWLIVEAELITPPKTNKVRLEGCRPTF